jgi:ABC-type branched-subunit amino acid transport system ATPase component
MVAGYGETQILHGVGVYVNEGEIVSVIGPNGSGKSTLLKAIVGLIKVRKGSVRLLEREVTNQPPEQIIRQSLSYVPQAENIFPSLTIRENLDIGAYTRHRDKNEGRLQSVFELFPVLAARSRTRAGVLSSGQRQMLAIARALMVDPKVMLLDEPTAALSPKFRGAVFEKIEAIGRAGTAILLVEQNARQSLLVSSRAYVLGMGRNQLDGDAQTLLNNEEVARVYLGR